MDGPDVFLCIHGLGCNRRSFDGLWSAPGLRDISCIVPDLPGYGATVIPAGFSASMANYADICCQLLDAIGAEHVHILGHSMGGAIASLMAGRLASRFASFICVEGNLVPADCSIASRQTIEDTLEAFIATGFSRLRHGISKLPHPGPAQWLHWSMEANPHVFWRSALSLVKWTDSGELLDRFLALAVPVVYIHGADNAGMALLEALKHLPIVSIAGSGHFPMNDNPHDFYAAVTAFLSSLDR